jgi:hypothetical protein
MFCSSRLVFYGIEDVMSRFHVLCYRTRFQRCRGPLVYFSYFALLDSFSTVLKELNPVFIFCATVLILDGIIQLLLITVIIKLSN